MVFTNSRWHYNQHLKNKTLNWAGTDKEKEFEELLRNNPNDESYLHYKDNPITYKFNNFGFRTPTDFNKDTEGNVYLGCSHTCGIGHYLENTWSWRFNQKIGGGYFNLALGGTGIGTSARLLEGYKDMFKIKNVFLFHPHAYRYEYYDSYQRKWIVASINSWDADKPYSTRVISETENMKKYWFLNYMYIEKICRELNVPLYTISPYLFVGGGVLPYYASSDNKDAYPIKARDTHLSVGDQVTIAEKFYDVYSNKTPPYNKPWMVKTLT